MTVGALEPQFFAELMERLGLASRFPASTQRGGSGSLNILENDNLALL